MDLIDKKEKETFHSAFTTRNNSLNPAITKNKSIIMFPKCFHLEHLRTMYERVKY